MNLKHLLLKLGKTIVIWLSTNLLGTAIVAITQPSLSMSEILMGIFLTLTCSLPVAALLIPNEHIIRSIASVHTRVAYAVCSIFALSFGAIALFFVVFDFRLANVRDLAPLVIPYIFSAQLCFLLIARPDIQLETQNS